MITSARRLCRSITLSLWLVTLASSALAGADGPAAGWVGTWATSPFPEPAAKEQLPLVGATLRQIVHVSLGGNLLRLRLSNAFGTTPLALDGVHLALAGPVGTIQPDTDRTLRFNGQTSVSPIRSISNCHPWPTWRCRFTSKRCRRR